MAAGTEEAADGKGLIANHLGAQPEPRTARDQSILGIAGEGLRRDLGALPVRCGRDEEPEEGLLVPAEADQLRCEPVE